MPASSCLCRLVDHWQGGFPRDASGRTHAGPGRDVDCNPRSLVHRNGPSGRDTKQPIFSFYATTAGARRPQVVLLLLVSPSYYSRSFFAVLATLYHASPLGGGLGCVKTFWDKNKTAHCRWCCVMKTSAQNFRPACEM